MDNINYKNVLCIGPSGTSDEAMACKNFIHNLLLQKINVLWKPIKIDDTIDGDSEMEKMVSKTKGILLNYSEVVLCCHPKRWDEQISFFKIKEDKHLIGRPHLQKKEITEEIISIINNSKIKTLCLFNNEVYIKTKTDVSKDIFVENTIFNIEEKQILSISGDWYEKEYPSTGVFRWIGENAIINIVNNIYDSIRICSVNEFNSKTITFKIKKLSSDYETFHTKAYSVGEIVNITIPIKEVESIQILSDYFCPSQQFLNNQDRRRLSLRIKEFYFSDGENEFYQTIENIKDETEIFYSKWLDQELLVTQHDKYFSNVKCDKIENILDDVTVLLTCHGDRLEFGKKAYESIVNAGIKNIAIVLSGDAQDYINWVESLKEQHEVLIISEVKDNNECWTEGLKLIKTYWSIILHDDDLLTEKIKYELQYLNYECAFGAWNGSVNDVNDTVRLENTVDIKLKRGIYNAALIKDLLTKYPLTVSPIHGIFPTLKLIDCLQEWQAKHSGNKDFYVKPTFVIGNDIFIWIYFCKEENLFYYTPERCTKCVAHPESATEKDWSKDKTFVKIYDLIKDTYIKSPIKSGILLFLPNLEEGNLKCLENLFSYKHSKYDIPIVIFSDSQLTIPSKFKCEFIKIPMYLQNFVNGVWTKSNKIGFWAFINAIQIAREKQWDYFFYYEWDCKVGNDYWYDILWQEHLAWQKKPILTGTPVFKYPNPAYSNIFQGMTEYRTEYAKQCKVNMLIENNSPLCLYTNGALSFYDTEKMIEYYKPELNLEMTDLCSHADKTGPWDLNLGIKIFKRLREKSFERVGWLPSCYSGCTDLFYTQKQRDYMLQSGLKVAIHQNKY